MARYIDAERFDVVTSQRCSEDFMDGMDYILEMIENAPTEDVVPRSEVERLQAQNETLEILVKDLRFRNKEFQKANEGLAKSIENLEIENDILRETKQDVARELIKEFECNLEILHQSANVSGNIMTYWETLKAELKKKYIGE